MDKLAVEECECDSIGLEFAYGGETECDMMDSDPDNLAAPDE
ncbi:hypothetical protein chiPu_0023081, partial [Chiloscyllium punctatum]|nr:hypothetical protein [Chiloscyllium punctatum]